MQFQSTSSRDKADAVLNRILELFESGELPQAVVRSTIARLESDAPSAAWSLSNRLLMLLAGTDDARGYRQWQAAGRQVTKGAKAFTILGPSTRKVKDTDPETGQERERVILTGFRAIPVFAVEDTEGEPIERSDYTPAQLPPLAEVAERLGVSIRWTSFVDRYYGYYCPGRNEIVLCSPDSAVFWHELAHAAHRVVLEASDRKMQGGQNSRQEVVAETVAAVLAAMYDFDLGELATAREYVRSYAGSKTPGQAIVGVIADVQAVLDLILTPASEPVAVAA